MGKLSGDLYKATKKLGKIASTVNDLEHLGKSIATGDPSHIANRVARKATNQATHKGADKVSKQINKYFK
ncbi:hypothetical protein CVD28_03800 [Bacillus sp. M6-12]|uniref:hypothetical protein n=1 Tax=Bacillus sp. M6-12 TaxID=2054166 RepID=UPI000C789BC0|nr:hypothetical protein [Bacillus sp. M6-12]PLS19551.1 hypothetical protein CVD28_03800 [Bacillus sp. M6-12]